MSTKPTEPSTPSIKVVKRDRGPFMGGGDAPMMVPSQFDVYGYLGLSCDQSKNNGDLVLAFSAGRYWDCLMEAPVKKVASCEAAPTKKLHFTYGQGRQASVALVDPFYSVLLLPGSMKHALIKSGMPTKVLTTFVDRKYPGASKQSVLESIGLSGRTVRRKTEEELLSTSHTNAAFALIEVTELATEVLGDEVAAVEWLTNKALGLDNERPIDLLSTSPGIESVKTLLTQIRYGVYA